MVLKEVGVIENISGFTDRAINQAIKELNKKNNGGNKKMNTKKLNMDDFITNIDEFSYAKGEKFYTNKYGETLAPHAFKILYKKGYINKNEWQLVEVK